MSAVDLKFYTHVLLMVLYKKASCTIRVIMTDFLIICIM